MKDKTNHANILISKCDLNTLAETRYMLLLKGYINKTELKRFVPCGQTKALRIWEGIKDSMKAEGIEKLQGDVILVSRVIKYLGLTEQSIIESYDRQRKGLA